MYAFFQKKTFLTSNKDNTSWLKAQSHGHCKPPLQYSCKKQIFAFYVWFWVSSEFTQTCLPLWIRHNLINYRAAIQWKQLGCLFICHGLIKQVIDASQVFVLIMRYLFCNDYCIHVLFKISCKVQSEAKRDIKSINCALALQAKGTL